MSLHTVQFWRSQIVAKNKISILNVLNGCPLSPGARRPNRTSWYKGIGMCEAKPFQTVISHIEIVSVEIRRGIARHRLEGNNRFPASGAIVPNRINHFHFVAFVFIYSTLDEQFFFLATALSLGLSLSLPTSLFHRPHPVSIIWG